VSAFAAIATPALAAGLVAGTAGAVKVVADTGPMAHAATTLDGGAAADDADAAPSRSVIATGEPRRLSALSGTDDAAWASAREVQVRKMGRKH